MALSPAEIIIEETSENTGITTLELANGVQVYLKPTTFKNDEIIMSATSEGGSSLYDDKDYFHAYGATGIVSESGIGKFSSIQLGKLMSGKRAGVRPFIGTYYEGMSGSASPKDVEDMFRMVYLYFTDVRNDSEAFTSYINKQLGIYENLKKNPNFYFSDYVSKLKYRNHPRVGFPEAYKWKSIDHQKALELYKDRFGDASDFAFTFVGSFDIDEMKMLTQKYLGNLPSTNREETYKDLEIKTIPGNLKKRIKKGEAPKTQVHMYYSGDFVYSPENTYHLSSALAYLRIKLREELREDKGGVYGVRVGGGGSRVPTEKYSITISFNSDPEKTDELIKAAKDVIQQAKKEGPDDIDMNKVIETQRQTKIKNMEDNRYWSRRIEFLHNEGESFENILMPAFEKKVAELKASDLKNAINKYFGQNYIEIVMDPADKPQN